LGAAIVAGAGVGMFKDLQEASIQMVETHARFEPNTKNTEKYGTIYQKYIELYESLCSLFQKEDEV
jgi:sugar (pentulose or hexulose) kinase